MTARNRKRNGAEELEMAHEALDGAGRELVQKAFRNALSRAYFAAFQTARAALMARGIQDKRHGNILRRFSSKVAGCGAITKRHADILGELLQVRGVADYGRGRDVIQITESLATRLIADAETFVRDVEAWTRAEWERMRDA